MDTNKSIIVYNANEIDVFAADFVSNLKTKDYGLKAALVGLSGQLGAGKTTFTQALARVLGVEETVNSPTFVIMKIYKLAAQPWDHLVHIDAYRLASGEELISLGWEEIVDNPKNLVVVEWAERIEDMLPDDYTQLNFSVLSENERLIERKTYSENEK
jgi:tRNA threonylcarbamoyladenosine biosynthesis protein TsaE